MKRRLWYQGAFWAYCSLMVLLLFGRIRFSAADGYWNTLSQHLNLEPLHTVRLFANVLQGNYDAEMRRIAIVNLVGNVVMFLPLGFMLPLLWKGLRKWWMVVLWGTGVVVCVELVQLFALVGNCDIDDLLLNLVGITIGYGLFCVICRYGTEKTS